MAAGSAGWHQRHARSESVDYRQTKSSGRASNQTRKATKDYNPTCSFIASSEMVCPAAIS